jgi:hypothetical protein
VKKVLFFAVISVLIVSVSSASIYAQSQYDIPSWVKGVAGFWAEDKISDSEFGEGLSFLIDNKIIKVPLIQELENEIAQLEDENAELRKMKGIPRPEPPLEPEPEPTPEPTPEPDVSTTISTDQNLYDADDLITVKGLVGNYISGPATLLVSDPAGNTVLMDQVYPRASSGVFKKIINSGGPLWDSGTYKITINYRGIVATTTFEFTTGKLPELATEPEVSTVSTDQNSYVDGDLITVKGLVRNYSSGPFTMIVSNPVGDTTSVVQLTPRSNGEFTANIQTGPTFDYSGTYTITINYRGMIATTTFEFTNARGDLPEPVYEESDSSCDPSYPDVCIPPFPPDLNCADIVFENFRVVGSDPHGFDGDGDGIGCES